jgi:hypothetical protein
VAFPDWIPRVRRRAKSQADFIRRTPKLLRIKENGPLIVNLFRC